MVFGIDDALEIGIPLAISAASTGARAAGVGKNNSNYVLPDADAADYAQTNALSRKAGALGQVANQYANRGLMGATPEEGQSIYNSSNQARSAMTESAQMYRDSAYGVGPSAAQAQLQAGTDQSLRAQMAAANSTRGGTMGLVAAQRRAAEQGVTQQAGLAAQSASLRAQEQQAGMQGYAQQTGALANRATTDEQAYYDRIQRQQAANDQSMFQALQMAQQYDTMTGQAMTQATQNKLDNMKWIQQMENGKAQYNAGQDEKTLDKAVGTAQGIFSTYGDVAG